MKTLKLALAAALTMPALEPLLKRLTMPNLLRLISATLCERRILVVSKTIGTSSACIHALLSLIYLFIWQNILLPVGYILG